MLRSVIAHAITVLMPTEIEKILADAAERIKRDAYASGWNDAIEAVKNALVGLGTAPIPQDIQISGSSVVTSAPVIQNANASRGPAIGSTPHYVLNALKERPGMGSTEIVDAVRSEGHSAPDGSIRTTIFRLRDRKLIVSRHGKWFPV